MCASYRHDEEEIETYETDEAECGESRTHRSR